MVRATGRRSRRRRSTPIRWRASRRARSAPTRPRTARRRSRAAACPVRPGRCAAGRPEGAHPTAPWTRRAAASPGAVGSSSVEGTPSDSAASPIVVASSTSSSHEPLARAAGSSTVMRTVMCCVLLRRSTRADPIECSDERGEDAAAGCLFVLDGQARHDRRRDAVLVCRSPGAGAGPVWGRSDASPTTVTEPLACSPSAETTRKLNWSTATSPDDA